MELLNKVVVSTLLACRHGAPCSHSPPDHHASTPRSACSCMQGLPGSSTASQTLVSFQAAALHKDWHLAWTVAPVLQPQHCPPSWAWVQLKLRSPPPLPMVSLHLPHCCDQYD